MLHRGAYYMYMNQDPEKRTWIATFFLDQKFYTDVYFLANEKDFPRLATLEQSRKKKVSLQGRKIS